MIYFFQENVFVFVIPITIPGFDMHFLALDCQRDTRMLHLSVLKIRKRIRKFAFVYVVFFSCFEV